MYLYVCIHARKYAWKGFATRAFKLIEEVADWGLTKQSKWAGNGPWQVHRHALSHIPSWGCASNLSGVWEYLDTLHHTGISSSTGPGGTNPSHTRQIGWKWAPERCRQDVAEVLIRCTWTMDAEAAEHFGRCRCKCMVVEVEAWCARNACEPHGSENAHWETRTPELEVNSFTL